MISSRTIARTAATSGRTFSVTPRSMNSSPSFARVMARKPSPLQDGDEPPPEGVLRKHERSALAIASGSRLLVRADKPDQRAADDAHRGGINMTDDASDLSPRHGGRLIDHGLRVRAPNIF